MIAALCFLIFINDLPDSVTDSFSGIFADDTIVAKEIAGINDSKQLQNDLDNIQKWTKMWGMEFNVVKCEILTVTNKRDPVIHPYKIKEIELQRKSKIK